MLPNNFEEYTFENANEIFTELKKRVDKQKTALNFVRGDDWQNGGGWVGPHFEGSGEVESFLKKEVERDFTPKGTIKSIVRRKRRGVVGKVPGWQFSSRNAPANPEAEPPAGVKQLIAEAQKIMNEFWKHSRVHPTLQEHVTDFETVGHSPLRLFFVQNNIGKNSPIKTIEQAVRKIYLFREEPGTACVVLNKETLQRASFCRYEKDGMIYIEMCYVDDDGNTVYKRLSKDNTKDYTDKNFPTSIGKYNKGQQSEDNEPVVLPLNGQLLVFELSGTPLVSSAMCAQQKLENKGYTMMSHNLDTDGFRAKKILNGMAPGHFEEKAGSAQKVFVPNENEVKVGPGSVEFINGLPIVERDPDGRIKQSYTTPSVHESQPIDVKTFTESIKAAKEAQLEEADQLHVAAGNDGNLAAESRIQLRDDYRGSLEDTKSLLDEEMSNVCETVLSIVAYLMEQPGRYDELQVTFSCKLNVGPRTVEERQQAQSESEGGFRSRESAMEEMNIEDPDAMKAKIKQEEEENPPEPKTKPNPDDPNQPPAEE